MKHSQTYVDLSHNIEDGLITYKGLPAPIVCDYLSRKASRKFYEKGTEFHIGKIEMVANTGTYIDVPFHRFERGKDLTEMQLSAFCDLEALCISIPYQKKKEIELQDLLGFPLKNRAVLIHTGWSEHWNTNKYFEKHPFLTESAAQYLKEQEVLLVGIDSYNIDDTRGKSRPAHTILLGSEILIVEHLCNLEALKTVDSFLFSAIPPKVKGMGSFPVRAFAKLQLDKS